MTTNFIINVIYIGYEEAYRRSLLGPTWNGYPAASKKNEKWLSWSEVGDDPSEVDTEP